MDTEDKSKIVPLYEEKGERSVRGSMRDFVTDFTGLLNKQIELAKSEMNDKIDQAQNGIVSIITGGAILFFGVQILLAAAVVGLSYAMPLWASALIIGLVVTVIGLVLYNRGRKALKAGNLKPEQTIESLDRDRISAKETWHELRKHG
ncbi:MAG TPA: phage holin family protein [Bdellovibrionota bacterium]|nr:phage holin family protein [Bdellovibrionota bacterium]